MSGDIRIRRASPRDASIRPWILDPPFRRPYPRRATHRRGQRGRDGRAERGRADADRPPDHAWRCSHWRPRPPSPRPASSTVRSPVTGGSPPSPRAPWRSGWRSTPSGGSSWPGTTLGGRRPTSRSRASCRTARSTADFGGGDGRVTTDLGGTDYGFDLALGSRGRIVVAGERDRPPAPRWRSPSTGHAARSTGDSPRTASRSCGSASEFQGANAVAVGRERQDRDRGVDVERRDQPVGLGPPASERPPRSRRSAATGGSPSTSRSSAEQINDLAIVGRGKIVAAGSAEVGLTPRIAIARVPGEREARPHLRQARA